MIMQRRIKAQRKETVAYQALIDHKRATLNVILSRIPDISTFAQLGELIGYSHEWVRQRLVQAPEKLYKNGKRCKQPSTIRADQYSRRRLHCSVLASEATPAHQQVQPDPNL